MITLKDIQIAQENIKDSIKRTPLIECPLLNQLTKANVKLKLENLQKTGSFKVRGALNKIQYLTEEEKNRGVIASSAGNHAQGVALGAQQEGIKATIVMPKFAPISKIIATQSYGANVVLEGDTFNDAYLHAVKLQKETNAVFLHAFDDDIIIAGQGTLGLEVYEDFKDVDILLCPVGGGGLMAGIAVALKESNPNIQIIGVEAENIPSMKKALESDAPLLVTGPQTIADGIAVGRVGDRPFDIFKKYVDDVVLVNEDEISQAILFLLEKSKVVAEGAGATALAALLFNKIGNVEGKNIAVVISGGNIDITNIEKIVNRAQIIQKKRAKLHILLKDNVGELSKITNIVSENKANILYLNQTRYSHNLKTNEQLLELVIECVDSSHLTAVLDNLSDKGIEYSLV
ncbi:threonine ammonia-lyase [Pseudostreptobacillus hongkongensis]|uniref:threonine ammonia-lyase n=1 Tax=Pseudostreptobacillus hongkongensis TaxID=1162717 RepID=UPI00082A324D|nr:threonine ammonia-lyase [Pseudostreptobacillus hongkongensis]